MESRSQNEELTSLADEAQSLKDEMDVLRWGSERVLLGGALGAEGLSLRRAGPVLSQHVVGCGKLGILSEFDYLVFPPHRTKVIQVIHGELCIFGSR